MLKHCITALITPFKDGKIDYQSFAHILDMQMENGVKALIVNGTTAEASTMSLAEKREAAAFVCDYVSNDIKIGIGVSSNDTQKLIAEINNVEDLRAEYLLITSPYYNKTSQQGLIAHIQKAIANTNKSIILYNIPSRTGMQFDVKTVCTLAQNEQVVAIKEASGDIDYVQKLITRLAPNFSILCGNDDLAYTYSMLGCTGTISATANVFPNYFVKLYQLLADNQFIAARELHYKYLPLNQALFEEVNPILIKSLLSALKIVENELRLPLVAIDDNKLLGLYEQVMQ